jgi:hypothetical protein
MQAPQMMNIKPAYQVQRLTGVVKRPVRNFVDGKIVTTEREEPAGFMVYFPQGTSMRVRTIEELVAYGLGEEPQLIDMETGDPFVLPRMDLKAEVERQTKRRGRVGVSDVAIDAEEE